jgi:hypothetical protein
LCATGIECGKERVSDKSIDVGRTALAKFAHLDGASVIAFPEEMDRTIRVVVSHHHRLGRVVEARCGRAITSYFHNGAIGYRRYQQQNYSQQSNLQ